MQVPTKQRTNTFFLKPPMCHIMWIYTQIKHMKKITTMVLLLTILLQPVLGNTLGVDGKSSSWVLLDDRPNPKPVLSEHIFNNKTSASKQAQVEMIAITKNNNDPAITLVFRELIVTNAKPEGCESIATKGGKQDKGLSLIKFNNVWVKTYQTCTALGYSAQTSEDGTTTLIDSTGESIKSSDNPNLYQISAVISNLSDANKAIDEFKRSKVVTVNGEHEFTAVNFTKTFNAFSQRLGME